MLVVFNGSSPVMAIANEVNCGARFAFRDASDIDRLSKQIAEEWFLKGNMDRVAEIDLPAFLPYTAEAMTGRLAGCFDSAVERYAQRT
jgi:hypothetical protein